MKKQVLFILCYTLSSLLALSAVYVSAGHGDYSRGAFLMAMAIYSRMLPS